MALKKKMRLRKGLTLIHKRYGIPAKITNVKEVKVTVGKWFYVKSGNRLVKGIYDEVGLRKNFAQALKRKIKRKRKR